MQTAVRSFFLSVFLLAATITLAGPRDLRDRLEKADTQAKFERLLPDIEQALGKDWDQSARQGDGWQDQVDVALEQLDNLVAQEDRSKGKLADAQGTVKDILAKPEYHDNGVTRDKNWLSQTIERAGRVIGDWFNNLWKKLFGQNEMNYTPSGFGRINFQPVVWALLIGGLVLFAFYAVTRFRWASRRKIKAGGLLEDDEPDRTADEWITRSEELSANSQFREAVRCLYLASLVRFDEANVMRFRRGETNWEHLRRFESSPRRPTGLDLTWPTRAFDVIWYGYKTDGQADVDRFRKFYDEVCQATARLKAA